MNEVIVVAGCTHRAGFLDEYEGQLSRAGVPFHLEHLDPLPSGANSISMQRRIKYFRAMASRFIEYKTIFITDAWDVLFFGSKQELIDKAPETFVVSGERNCYPEAHMSDKIHGNTPWKYVNNGMIAASPKYLLEWADHAEKTNDLEILDQAWFNRRRSEGSDLAPLDTTTSLFYVVSACLEDGSLRAKNGRPWNAKCDTYPNFLHFSGGCPSEGVRKMLEEKNEITV